MAENERAVEFICIHCYQGFSSEESSAVGGTEERLVCPHCGEPQPSVDELLAEYGESVGLADTAATTDSGTAASGTGATAGPAADSLQAYEELQDPLDDDSAVPRQNDAAPPPSNGGVVVPIRPSGPEAAASAALALAAEAEQPPAPNVDLSEPAEEEDATSLEAQLRLVDPATATWKLRSPIGLTYNFPGIVPLKRWAAGRSSAEQMTISLSDIDEWRSLESFLEALNLYPDPRVAFLRAALPDGTELEFEEPAPPPSNLKPGSELARIAAEMGMNVGSPLLPEAPARPKPSTKSPKKEARSKPIDSPKKPDSSADRSSKKRSTPSAVRSPSSRHAATESFSFRLKPERSRGLPGFVWFLVGLAVGAGGMYAVFANKLLG